MRWMRAGAALGSLTALRYMALAVICAALATLLVMSALSGGAAPYLALLAPPCVLAVALHRRLRPVYLSPPWIVVLVLTGVGLVSFALRGALNGQGGGGITLYLNDLLATKTAYLFAGFSAAIVLGVVAVAAWHPRGESHGFELSVPSQWARSWILAGSLMPLIFELINDGGELFHRPTHLIGSAGSSVTGAIGAFSLGAVAVLGYLVKSDRGLRRFVAVAGAAAYFVLFFGESTRQLSVAPALFAIGLTLAGKRRRVLTLLTGIALVVALMPVPLFLRGQSVHGIVPYLQALPSFSYGDVNWLASINNVLLAFPITAYAAFVHAPLPITWLWIELNPAPGNLAGWYDIHQSMGLNNSTPFSSMGELGNYGIPVVAGVGIVLGMLLGYLDARIGRYISQGSPFVAVAIAGMSGMVAVTALQYSTRTTERLLLYLLVAEIAVRVWQQHTARQKASADPRDRGGGVDLVPDAPGQLDPDVSDLLAP